MPFPPVIQRELQVASRRRETWRLRVVFGGLAVLAFGFGMVLPQISPSERGQVTLISLALAGFVLCLFTGPYLTADAVSSEKREGTLGLLLLTPLKGWQIILGKMVTHALQVGYAVVGGFLVFFLPVLLGGVVWSEVVRILLVLVLTLLSSLACGMLWSALATEARTSVLGSTVSLLLIALLPWLWPFVEVLTKQRSVHLIGVPQVSPLTLLTFAFETNYRISGVNSPVGGDGAVIYWGATAASVAGSFLFLSFSAYALPRVWRKAEEGVPAGIREKAKGGRFTSSTSPWPEWRPAREVAPLAWLYSRGLRASSGMTVLRIVTLCFFSVMLATSVLTDLEEAAFTAAVGATFGLHLVTRVQMALMAARNLHDDRRSGALELLLATPVAEDDVVHAHHAVLKRAFLKPVALLLTMNLVLELTGVVFFDRLHMDGGSWAVFSTFFLGGALITVADARAVRWLALREALRSATHLKAVGRILATLALVPWLGFGGAFLVAAQGSVLQAAGVFVLWTLFCVVYDGVLVAGCRRWLRLGLRRRASGSWS